MIEDECGTCPTTQGRLESLILHDRCPAHLPPCILSGFEEWLWRHEYLYTGPDQLSMLVHEAIHEITPEISLGWFSDCGYVP